MVIHKRHRYCKQVINHSSLCKYTCIHKTQKRFSSDTKNILNIAQCEHEKILLIIITVKPC